MSALATAAAALACPRCGDPVEVDVRTLRCPRRHSFDIARQGYVNLLSRPAGAAADDAAMVAARDELLGSGLFAPVTEALRTTVSALDLPAGGVLDVGAGTGHHTAVVLDVLPGRVGIATDLSTYAARRAARAHPRLASLVADVWERLPLRSGSMALVLDVFAPRNAEEFARVLTPGGVVVVATPAPDHLHELVTALDMPTVDPHKAERLAVTFAAFETGRTERVRTEVEIDGARAATLVAMGPAAHHVAPERLEVLRSSDLPVTVTLAVDVTVHQVAR